MALKKLNSQIKTPVSRGYLELSNDDFVSSNVDSCHKGTMLYIFEVNEAVIKMIMKGRSPTLRHVSRTHIVALDWFFDRIFLDPKIQIRYVESTNSQICWRKGISPLNDYGETRYSGFCHRRRYGGMRRIQYSFCRVNFIQRKSEQEITDDVKSSIRGQYGWHWYAFPHVTIFMTSSMCPAIFLGEDYSPQNLHVIRNTDEKPTVKKVIDATQRLIQEQRLGISEVSEISSATSPRERLSLVNDEEIINLSKAKVYVFSDSELCLGKIRPFPQSNDEWRVNLEWFKQRIG